MSRNLVLDLGLDCPSCGSSDLCQEDCGCPACYLPPTIPVSERDASVTAWRTYAPLLSALNAEGVRWGWATETHYTGVLKHSIEILGEYSDCWIEVSRWGNGYICELWRNTRGSRERNEPPEAQHIDSLEAHTEDEAVIWVANAARNYGR